MHMLALHPGCLCALLAVMQGVAQQLAGAAADDADPGGSPPGGVQQGAQQLTICWAAPGVADSWTHERQQAWVMQMLRAWLALLLHATHAGAGLLPAKPAAQCACCQQYNGAHAELQTWMVAKGWEEPPLEQGGQEEDAQMLDEVCAWPGALGARAGRLTHG